MRRHRYYRPILLLALALTGCSTTAGSRFGGTPQAKSIAVVGERPMPASTGEPGGQVVADVAEPEPRRNPKTRISGRVVDDQGEPVPNVTVRLADGGTKGGKDIRSTTDRSGAFTLNGLRPGSTYSIIAESEDAKGPLIGRTQARTADTSVEIRLLAEGSEAGTAAKSSGRPTRVKQISNREEFDSNPGEDEGPKVNREDLLPPANDAGEIDPGPPPPAGSGRPRLSAPQSTAGWRNSSSAKAPRTRPRDEDIVASSLDDPPKRRRAKPAEPDDTDEDGPNPLPPAINTDPGEDQANPRRSPARNKAGTKPAPTRAPEPGEINLGPEAKRDDVPGPRKTLVKDGSATVVATKLPQISELDPDPSPSLAPPPLSAALPAMPPMGGDQATAMESPQPTASPPASAPVSQNVASTDPAPRPVSSSEPRPMKPTPTPPAREEYNPFALVETKQPVVRSSDEDSPSTLMPDNIGAATATTTTDVPQPVAEAPKKKWGDLAATGRPAVVFEPTKATSSSTSSGSLVKRLRGSVEHRDPSVALCSYDARQQKLKDFRLPDLEGKPVHFQDLGADFVLLDFWGTWCGPCLDSIPHLIALQKKYGPSRLKVVGIACEEVPPEQRKAKVEEVARKLGINYAVLLSSMDGKPCPVQQALQIQAMPTMILVDRLGKVVWRNTGSTAPTLDRLDRVLASSMGRGETVRR